MDSRIRHTEDDKKIKETINQWMKKENKVLCIKSPMDTGKTYMMIQMLKINQFERILFITHRITFADDIGNCRILMNR